MDKELKIKGISNAVSFLKKSGKIKRDGEIARDTEFNKSTVSQYITGRQEPSNNFIKKFEDVYKLSINDFVKGDITGQDGTPTPQEEVKTNDRIQINNDGNLSTQAILNLTESNRILAEAHRDLAKNTIELTLLIKATVNVYINNPPAFDATLTDLLEVIADVGTGKRWDDKNEALAELSRQFVGKARKIREADIPHD